MRKKMTKQVTKTTVKMAQMDIVDGQPVAVQLPDEILLGNVTIEKAQRIMEKKHKNVTVLNVVVDSEIYEMNVVDFIKHATIREEGQQEEN